MGPSAVESVSEKDIKSVLVRSIGIKSEHTISNLHVEFTFSSPLYVTFPEPIESYFLFSLDKISAIKLSVEIPTSA
jgi:hypothetical protein